MMQDDLFLIIKTNKYTGNFERELMAFVFGITDKDADESDYEDELNSFQKALQNSPLINDYDFEDSPFFRYVDSSYFGRRYSEYHCYEIISHPENEKYDCDSIVIAISNLNNNPLPKEYFDFMIERLEKFTEFIAKEVAYPQEGIKILDVNYFTLNFSRKVF